MSDFARRVSVEQIEQGLELAPRFDENGLLPVVATDADSGAVLMLGYMNAEALQQTLATGEAHYWSRSRSALWRKGETSGMVHKIAEMRIDDDQDSVWLRVHVGGRGGSCHVGYRSCFYRAVEQKDGGARLIFVEHKKTFDPAKVYGDLPNPTKI